MVEGFSRLQIALHRVVAVLIVVQVTAALYHQFILKYGLLNRMRRPC
ncbi:MAG: hypothetical protein WCS20_03985 [Alphaproteobacteria bacterium]